MLLQPLEGFVVIIQYRRTDGTGSKELSDGIGISMDTVNKIINFVTNRINQNKDEWCMTIHQQRIFMNFGS